MQTGSVTMATEGIGHGCQVQAILLTEKKKIYCNFIGFFNVYGAWSY